MKKYITIENVIYEATLILSTEKTNDEFVPVNRKIGTGGDKNHYFVAQSRYLDFEKFFPEIIKDKKENKSNRNNVRIKNYFSISNILNDLDFINNEIERNYKNEIKIDITNFSKVIFSVAKEQKLQANFYIESDLSSAGNGIGFKNWSNSYSNTIKLLLLHTTRTKIYLFKKENEICSFFEFYQHYVSPKTETEFITSNKEIIMEELLKVPDTGMTIKTEFFPDIIYYGPPGTGKTRKIQFNHLVGKNETNSKFITFHQSYSYEEFIEGLKPTLAKESVVLFKSSTLTQFVEIVFKELIKVISIDYILSYSNTRPTSIEAISYTAYSIENYFGSSILFGAFNNKQPQENLQSGINKTSRFYYNYLFVKDGIYFYLSNQWYGNGNYELHINNLIDFVNNISNGLLTVENRNGEFYLSKEVNSNNIIYSLQKGLFYEACEAAAILAGYESLANCIADKIENRLEKMKYALAHG
ncbi:MAG: hypothetical protein LW701_11490, partial [Fluviicola sp.]|nr:hypothetical protein [Fluviicola sp.]